MVSSQDLSARSPIFSESLKIFDIMAKNSKTLHARTRQLADALIGLFTVPFF